MAPRRSNRRGEAAAQATPVADEQFEDEEGTQMEEGNFGVDGFDFRTLRERTRYNRLRVRIVVSTIFMHAVTLTSLGVSETVQTLFANVGWERFLAITHGTYIRPTLEFLSTVILDKAEQSISFRLGGIEYTRPLSTIAQAFGFPISAPMDIPETFSSHSFWTSIACKRDRQRGALSHTAYVAKDAKASEIYNLPLRVAQRIMAHTIFGRADSVGNCTLRELYVLYCMMLNIHFNPSKLMAIQWIKSTAGRESAEIVLGGMIGYYLGTMGLLPDGGPDHEARFITLDTLRNAHFLRRVGTTNYYTHQESQVYALPAPSERANPWIEGNLLPDGMAGVPLQAPMQIEFAEEDDDGDHPEGDPSGSQSSQRSGGSFGEHSRQRRTRQREAPRSTQEQLDAMEARQMQFEHRMERRLDGFEQRLDGFGRTMVQYGQRLETHGAQQTSDMAYIRQMLQRMSGQDPGGPSQ